MFAFLKGYQNSSFLRRVNVDFPPVADLQVKMAEATEDYVEAARLVDQSYRRRNPLFASPKDLRILAQTLAPTTVVVVAKSKGRVIATVTIVGQNPFGFPIQEILTVPERQIHLSHSDPGIIELASLAVAQDFVAPQSNVFYALIRYVFRFLRFHYDVSRLVIATQPNAVDYYRNVFGFNLIGSGAARSFPSAFGEPSIAMSATLEQAQKKFTLNAEKFPNLSALSRQLLAEETIDEAARMPDRKPASRRFQEKSVGMIEEIYLNKTGLMRQLDHSKRLRVQQMYPDTDGYRWVFQTDPRISQRRARRFVLNLQTVVAARSDGAGTSFRNGRVVDLSEFGALLQLDPGEQSLPPRGEITISLRTASGAEALMHGEVVHSRLAEALYGIKFTECNPEFHKYIAALARGQS